MPNIKSAKKRLRQNSKRADENLTVRSQVRSTRKNFLVAAAGEDKDAAMTAYKSYCSVLDKAAKNGRINKNTAVRRKSRAANKVRALS